MKDNKEILNEAFFKRKKETYADKIAKTMPQYEPVDKKAANVGFGSVFGAGSVNKQGEVLGIVDTDEAKRRLTGVLGMVLGTNTIKGMADRAIKKFPIIVSENAEPETVAMLKSLLEEQYADYINLMVSNQIIDLAEYEPNNPKGNIAIQALDKISGTDFGSQRIARKAQSGELTADDVFANVPIYQLFRQESLQTGNSIMDSLLENALVIDNENKDLVCGYLYESMMNNEEPLNEWVTDTEREVSERDPQGSTEEDKKKNKEKDYNKMNRIELKDLMNYAVSQSDHNSNGIFRVDADRGNTSAFGRSALEINKANSYMNRASSGLIGIDSHGNEIYNKLTNTNVTVDKKQLDSALNSSVADILQKNPFLKDRFEKATFLLSSRRIAGVEYIDYCTKRLGIPVSERARKNLVTEFKAQDVRASGWNSNGNPLVISSEDVHRIHRNVKLVNHYIAPSLKVSIKDLMIGGGVGAGVAAAGGALASATVIGSISIPVVGWFALAGIIGGAVGAAISKKLKSKDKIDALNRIEGWERVESLIDQMDSNVIDLNLKSKKFELQQKKLIADSSREETLYNKLTNDLQNSRRNKKPLKLESVKEGYEPTDNDFTLSEAYILLEEELECIPSSDEVVNREVKFTESECKHFTTIGESVLDSILESPEALKEAIVSTKQPIVVKKIKYDPKEFAITPTFGTKDLVAYGSVEYDKKEIKDRRYNTPLLLTIKFKERYSDGKFSDNELTAVIGILGVVTRVPSDEMAYILKANANGVSVKDIFQPSENTQDLISDLLSKFKPNKDSDKLPVSKEIWHNLEKVSALAVTNRLAGRNSGNVANAHIIFSQKEIDDVRLSDGVDYLKDRKLAASLMKRYSAVTLMVTNDVSEKIYIFDDLDSASWNVVPYSSLRAKGGSDNVSSALKSIARLSM